MKLFHVLTKYEGGIKIPKQVIEQLPETLIVMGTIQLKDQIPDIKKQLEAVGKKVTLFRGVHDTEQGQILGCDIFPSGKKVDAYLYVGDGLFHPTALLYGNKQPVFYYNPFTEKLVKLTQKDLQKVFNRRKASLSHFYAADNVGVLVSTKPGQNNLAGALELKKRLMDKKVFIFLDNTVSIGQLENFPFIDCWVNTACPRMIEDTTKPMINLWELRDTVMKGFGVKVV